MKLYLKENKNTFNTINIVLKVNGSLLFEMTHKMGNIENKPMDVGGHLCPKYYMQLLKCNKNIGDKLLTCTSLLIIKVV